MADQVNHPAHYNMGGPKEADGTAKYETIKVIEDWSTKASGSTVRSTTSRPTSSTKRAPSTA